MPETSDVVNVKLVSEQNDMGKQLVILGISAVATVAMLYLQRKLSGPDAFLTLKMRALAGIQDYADKRAKFWNDLSAAASAAYLNSRP